MTASLFDRSADLGATPDLVDDTTAPTDGELTRDHPGDPGHLGDLLGGSGTVPVDAIADLVAIALATILAVVVGLDVAVDGRWPLAVAFLAWAPGWAMVRAASIRASSLSLLVSVGLSTSLTILVGQGLIAWGWSAWRVVVVLVCVAVVAVLARDLRRMRP